LTKITDSLVELFIQLVHRINARAERWADKEMIAEFRRVRNKEHAVVEVIVVLRNRSRGGGWPAELDRDSKRRVRVVIWVSLPARSPAAAIAPAWPTLRWALFAVGVVLIVAGAGLRQWAISTLGRLASWTGDAQNL
jgi:hypothetical protein